MEGRNIVAIPQTFLDDLQARTDIVDVVSGYVVELYIKFKNSVHPSITTILDYFISCNHFAY